MVDLGLRTQKISLNEPLNALGTSIRISPHNALHNELLFA